MPTIRGLPVPVFQRHEQDAIASILGALDDKIELNRRMNETLEAMARAIFQDWFVTFGPTRAKMEGRPPYLVPDLWSLFPDRLDAEGKPEGWCASTIGEEVTVVGGTTPSTKEPAFWNGDLHWATPKDLSSLAVPVLLDTERRITAKGLSQIGSGLLPVGSVLLSSRAPIGYLAVNLVPTAINQGFIGMVCERRLSNMFVWLWTKANMEVILQKANGSTFQEISKSNFRPIPVVVPGTAVLGAFEASVRPLWDRLCANVREQEALAATRDLLLPRLMSGELRVHDFQDNLQRAE
jgi:type I restriction enzyme S subunit